MNDGVLEIGLLAMVYALGCNVIGRALRNDRVILIPLLHASTV